MDKTKIILLYENNFERGSIISTIRRSNFKIISKNNNILNLKDKCIILKKLNTNKANQLCKYKDCLILYIGKSDQIEELIDRCTVKLNLMSVSYWLTDEYISQYLREGANNLQIRYIADVKDKYSFEKKCVRQIYVMVTDYEKDLKVISDNNIRNGKKLYLDVNDAVVEYKESITKTINKYIKDKENLESTLLSKKLKQIEKKEIKEGIRVLNSYIVCYKALLKKLK